MVLGELLGPVTPYRAFPAERKMTKPMRRPHQRRALAGAGVGDSAVIRRPAKPHLMQGGASARSLRVEHSGCSIIRARLTLQRLLRGLAQRAAAHHVALFEALLRALKLFLGFAPAAS